MEYQLIEAFIEKSALIIIPTIYILGMFLKAIEIIKDKYIPIILLCIAIIISIALNGFNVNSILQAILCSGLAVFFNQSIKQLKK